VSLVLDRITADDVPEMASAFAPFGWAGKDAAQFTSYVEAQDAGERVVLIARLDSAFVGYGCVVWRSGYHPYERDGIPEIQDLNVLPQFRRRGIATALLDALEDLIASRSRVAGVGVGVYADYGAAMRLYVARGYQFDGRGLMYDGQPVVPGSMVRIDDGATLMLTKPVAATEGGPQGLTVIS
jgi:ribosomal protein S18 acetylase RimI-like enzyme